MNQISKFSTLIANISRSLLNIEHVSYKDAN